MHTIETIVRLLPAVREYDDGEELVGRGLDLLDAATRGDPLVRWGFSPTSYVRHALFGDAIDEFEGQLEQAHENETQQFGEDCHPKGQRGRAVVLFDMLRQLHAERVKLALAPLATPTQLDAFAAALGEYDDQSRAIVDRVLSGPFGGPVDGMALSVDDAKRLVARMYTSLLQEEVRQAAIGAHQEARAKAAATNISHPFATRRGGA